MSTFEATYTRADQELIKLREIPDVEIGYRGSRGCRIFLEVVQVHFICGGACLAGVKIVAIHSIEGGHGRAEYPYKSIGSGHRRAHVAILLQLLEGVEVISAGFRLVKVRVLEQIRPASAGIAKFKNRAPKPLFQGQIELVYAWRAQIRINQRN